MKVTYDYPVTYPVFRRRSEVPPGHFYSHLFLLRVYRLALSETNEHLRYAGTSMYRGVDLRDGRISSCGGDCKVTDYGPASFVPDKT